MIEPQYFAFQWGKVAYYLQGEGHTLVFLHGWGQDFSTFNNLIKRLPNNFQVLGIDLPGFGNSSIVKDALSIKEYSEVINKILNKLLITHPTIIAHSFGGRIAFRYGSNNSVKRLILISPAGIKHRTLKYYLKVYKYKFLKRFYKIFSKKRYNELVKNSGSSDYQKADWIMRNVLVKAVNYNSIKDMRQIKCPVYLFWGIFDIETPYSDGLKMIKVISNSKIFPFYNSGHFSYIQEEDQVFQKLLSLIIEDAIWK